MNKIATEIADQMRLRRPARRPWVEHSRDADKQLQWANDCEAVAIALENLEIIKNPSDFLISAGAWESSTAEGK